MSHCMERRYQPTTYTVIVQRLDSTKVGAFGTFGQLGMVLNKGERRIPRTCNLFSDACFPSKKKLSTNTLLPVSLYLDRVDIDFLYNVPQKTKCNKYTEKRHIQFRVRNCNYACYFAQSRVFSIILVSF